jgi:hypothetical protein
MVRGTADDYTYNDDLGQDISGTKQHFKKL